MKITHRLPAADDREAVGATMNATPAQSRYLVTLPPGEAAVFTDGMDFPVLVRIADGTAREAAGPGTTAGAGTVVRPRSASCGDDCQGRPCTLREIRAAERVGDELPWIRVWAELAVLAHLTGWPMPVPRPEVLAALRPKPSRLVQCALAHAADAAVAVRPCVPRPGALAAHVTAAASARVGRSEWFCAADEPDWLLPGILTEQAAFGTSRPAALETAGEPGGLDGTFIDCRWPSRYLRQSPGPVTG